MAVGDVPIDFEPCDQGDMQRALADPIWRLNNLYMIMVKSDDGDGVTLVKRFRPNRAQRKLIKNLWTRNIILKARQLGFSTFIDIFLLDCALFRENVRCGVVADTDGNAETLFRDKILFAYQHLPAQLQDAMPLKKETTRELVFAHNNSGIRVGTSMRSGTIHYLHVSEMGKMAARHPGRAREVVTGSIPAVPNDGMIFIESTAEGRDGDFYDMTAKSMAQQESGKKLNPIDFKFHFFAWHEAPEYRMEQWRDVVITEKDHAYFDQLEAQLDKVIDIKQRAWYCATRDSKPGNAQEIMWQEFPSTPGEAFQVSTEGTYFAEQLSLVRKEGRITSVAWTPNEPVNTFWDIGLNDEMAIWFHQRVRGQDRFIRYYENSGESFSHYVSYMQQLGYVWGKHYLPHDGDTKRLGTVQNWTPRQMLEDLGLREIEIVPRIDRVINGINMTRDAFPNCWFDEEKCSEGLKHLELYRKEWNERLGVWKDEPRHDKHSNGADSFRQFAQGYEPPRPHSRKRTASPNWRTA